jgi:hypothetical protein
MEVPAAKLFEKSYFNSRRRSDSICDFPNVSTRFGWHPAESYFSATDVELLTLYSRKFNAGE